MDCLLETLENLLDTLGNPDFEVEYHVSILEVLFLTFLFKYSDLERRLDTQSRRQRHICDQQTTSQ